MEAIIPDAPLPRWKEVDLCIFVGSNNAGSKQARNKLMISMNMLWIDWYSKKQSTIETSVFGAEFVAMKVRVEILHAIQYKLRMLYSNFFGPHIIMEIRCWLSIISQNYSQHSRRSVM